MNQVEIREAVKSKRGLLGMSLDGVSGETGVSKSTLSRFENGYVLSDCDHLVNLHRWAGLGALSDGSVSSCEPDTLAAICRVIRKDPTLTITAADALCDLMTAMYREFAK